MCAAEIAEALSSLPNIEVTELRTLVRGYVPAIQDGFRLVARDVVDLEHIVGPNGEPAVRLAVRSKEAIHCVIVTPTDVIFEPAISSSQLDSPIPIVVTNAPPLIAYSEMMRDVEKLLLACKQRVAIDLDGLGGSFLLCRCFIMGAAVFGLHPAAAVARWQHAWNIVKDDTWLPPFRPDPLWDKLVATARLP